MLLLFAELTTARFSHFHRQIKQIWCFCRCLTHKKKKKNVQIKCNASVKVDPARFCQEKWLHTLFIPKSVPHAGLTVPSAPSHIRGVKIKVHFRNLKSIPGGLSCAFNIALYSWKNRFAFKLIYARFIIKSIRTQTARRCQNCGFNATNHTSLTSTGIL